MSLELIYLWKLVEVSFSSIVYAGLIPLMNRFSRRSLKNRMNLLSDLVFMGRIKIIFLSYSYNTNIYLFTLFEVTGVLPVRYVAIYLMLSMILVNTVLVHFASGVIGSSSCLIVSCFLMNLMFFGYMYAHGGG